MKTNQDLKITLEQIDYVHKNRMRIIDKRQNYFCIGMFTFGVPLIIFASIGKIYPWIIFTVLLSINFILFVFWSANKEWPWSKESFNYPNLKE